jgi:hypothetical protein
VLLLLLLIVVGGIGGLNFRKEISSLISGEVIVPPSPPVSARPPEAAVGQPGLPIGSQPTGGLQRGKEAEIKAIPQEREMKATSLFLDEQAGLAGLFRLFNDEERLKSPVVNEVHLGLYSFHAEPEQYIMFKKPFLIRVADTSHHLGPGHSGPVPLPRYLLIREVTADGAIAIDADGEERLITRDFILTHWGQEVSWVYPYENMRAYLFKGKKGPDVIELQQALQEIGYSVVPTGHYGKSTFNQVMRFQKDFALKADGIVGTRTKGLLYQMSE